MTKVLYFGNDLVTEDKNALETVRSIKGDLPDVDFVHCLSPEEILSHSGSDVIILDVARGIKEVKEVADQEKIKHGTMTTLHDFDLGFFLKLLKRTGKKTDFKIIALPLEGDYEKRLVEMIRFYSNSSSRK